MLSSRTSILIYGRDPKLLETRRWVLERSGAHVRAATQLGDITQIAANVSIDLIVLCHSLSMEECGRALALANTLWPEVQSLVLISGQYGCQSTLSGQIADAARGPAHLLQTVTTLLEDGHGNNYHATQPNR